ncbi:sigma-54 dependent transcriptional regulator [bacterium]|nr:sigma-54 dependent transcriptional regulator [bacterium]
MANLSEAKILLVDDDLSFHKVTAFILQKFGARVTSAFNGREGLEVWKESDFDLILTDVKMPEMDGLDLLRAVRHEDSDLPVVLVTAHGDIEMAVEAMQYGASDFITKPFDRERLKSKLERCLRLSRLEQENRTLREELTDRYTFDHIVGSSPAIRGLFDLMKRVLFRDTTVLILGESGTGKELVAKALHYGGARRDGHFVAVNCAAIPASLLESELFGHVKGAFTGADASREGRFQTASGGTLFLDEIGDMPLNLQAKLLRVLQEQRIEPVGSSHSIQIDVRIIAATNKDLDKLVRDGEFREDLFYRLNVVPLHVPPLRDRKEDIPLLVRSFLKSFGEKQVKVEPAAMRSLVERPWRGNVRELENSIERMLALRTNPDRITAEDVEQFSPPNHAQPLTDLEIPEEGIVLDDLEKKLIERALGKTGGNQTRAASLLGITRQKLIYRMQKHGIA